MARETTIEVGLKRGVDDPSGRALEADIRHLGIRRVEEIRTSQLYRITGRLSAGERDRAASNLLCDPVIQEWREADKPARPAKGGPTLLIDIWLKPGVTDAVGESVAKGLRDMGINGVESVATGMRYRLRGLRRREAGERIASAFLYNPLIQEHRIDADR